MNQTTALLPDSTTDPWERATYAFLAEKQRLSGSVRTVQGKGASPEDLTKRRSRIARAYADGAFSDREYAD